MTRLISLPSLLLAVTLLAALLAGCSQETPEVEPAATPTTQPNGEPPAVEPETTAEPGNEPTPESSPSGLTAVIVSGDSAGAGKPFTFDATQSQPGELIIIHYQWNMGDGTTLFGISVEHAYDIAGLYTVTLTVTDEEGNIDVAAKVVEVTELTEEPPLATGDEYFLVGTSWLMDKPLRGTSVTLIFEETTLYGSAGCNSYEASYTAEETEGSSSTLSLASISTSSQSCTPEIMAQERGYLESLASVTSITVDESKMTMETDGGTLTFSQIESQ